MSKYRLLLSGIDRSRSQIRVGPNRCYTGYNVEPFLILYFQNSLNMPLKFIWRSVIFLKYYAGRLVYYIPSTVSAAQACYYFIQSRNTDRTPTKLLVDIYISRSPGSFK